MKTNLKAGFPALFFLIHQDLFERLVEKID